MPKPRLLLHVCCAPCSTHVIEELKEEYDLACFFYGPNIHPEEEYTRRMEESADYCSMLSVEFIEGNYEPLEWFQIVKGHENDEEGGERCNICHRFRLEKTASKARELGYEWFTTTLTISPHKDAAPINKIGEEVAKEHGVNFLARDFKKMHGFQKSVEMSKEHGMYRQDYCGCFFSRQRSA